MNYLTLGVLGHVDHGKTSLVKALTGVDTDRLKEEKERGISISLGYAPLELSRGRMGVVDVPGHEKFIRTMVAGATGIRAILLVLDVNEGVKPQTVEHLRIAELLGINHGVAAITKCDTVSDPDMPALAEEDLRDWLRGTFMENAPFVHTSAHSGQGLDELKVLLDNLFDEIEPLADEGLPCLPVDRVFSISGFGTVVTGTLQRGTLRLDDAVELYPGGQRAQVRELQAHNEFVDAVAPGHRTAVNLRGMEKQALKRGDVVAAPGSLQSGKFLSAYIQMLHDAEAPLKHRQMVRVLFGTQETFGRMHFLDRDTLEPGDETYAQIQLDDTAPVLFRDNVILRTYSPMTTIGGGTLLDVSENRLKRGKADAMDRLEVLHTGDAEEILEIELKRTSIVNLKGFARKFRFSQEVIAEIVKRRDCALIDSGNVALAGTVDTLKKEIIAAVESHHAKAPDERGVLRVKLVTMLSTSQMDELVDYVLELLLESNKLSLSEGFYHVPGFSPEGTMSDADQDTALAIAKAFVDGEFQPPGMVEVLQNDKQRMRIYRMLLDKGDLVSTFVANKPRTLSNTIVFHRDALEAARDMLRENFPNGSGFTPAEARDVLQTTRKYLIPLLECLDRKGITLRQGDKRVVR